MNDAENAPTPGMAPGANIDAAVPSDIAKPKPKRKPKTIEELLQKRAEIDRKIAERRAKDEAKDKARARKSEQEAARKIENAKFVLGGALVAAIRAGDESIAAVLPGLVERVATDPKRKDPAADRRRLEEAVALIRGQQPPTAAAPDKPWIRLEVAFADNEAVKAIGAKFRKAEGAWFAPPGADLQKFAKWLPKG